MRVAVLFFATGAVLALGGMAWGIQMSATHDHTLSAAHGHLNLLGFVGMSVFGAFYALVPDAARGRLPVVHYGLALSSVLILAPGIVLAITERGELLAQVGSLLAIGSMALFAYVTLRALLPRERAVQPAE